MGFTPLAHSGPAKGFTPGFTPLPMDSAEEQPGALDPAFETVKDIGRVYPVLETAANLATQMVAMPVAGIAGIGTIATNAMGITDTNPADVVHKVGGALTYQPKTDSGQHLTGAATYPFAKLAEAGQFVGGHTLDATGSPALATVADVAVNALPMALPMKAAEPKGTLTRAAEKYVRPVEDVIKSEPELQVSAEVLNPRQDGYSPMPVNQAMPEVTQNHFAGDVQRITQETPREPVSEAQTLTPIPIYAEAKATRTTSADATPNMDAIPPVEVAHSINAIPVERPIIEEAQSFSPNSARDVETLDSLPESLGQSLIPKIEARPVNPVDMAGDVQNRAAQSMALPDEVPTIASESPVNLERPANIAVEPARPATGFTPLESIPEQVRSQVPTQEIPIAQPFEQVRQPVDMVSQEVLPVPVEKPVNVEGQLAAEPLPLNAAPEQATPIQSIPEVIARQSDEVAPPQTESLQAKIPAIADQGNIPAIAAIEKKSGFTPIENVTPIASAELLQGHSQTLPPRSGFTPIESVMPDAPVDSRAAWAPGATYTGFVDHAATGTKLTDKPIRREDVLAPLMKDLGLRLYEGRVQGKRLGFYMPKLEAVRIKNKSDLEVAAHEIAHALDDRIPALRESWLKGDMAKVHADELRGVSYDKTKIYEGFAEFTRLYMTQPEKAKAAAPNYYKWFDGFTQQHKYGTAIRNAQDGMSAWFNQDALHRAQSKIGKQRVINDALDGMGDKFRQAVTDDLHGVYRMERQLTGKTSPLGAYETARLTRGAGGLVDGAIRLGSPFRKSDGSFDFQGKGLEKILEPVAGNLDEFLTYAVGRSSQELLAQGREKLFSQEEVRSMLKLKRPEFETAFKEYQTWNSGVLDFAESMGVINKQARNMWKRSQYLPYYRVGQAGASASKGGAQGNWAGIQALTGGTSNLRDILGNMTQNAATLIDTALKNEARAKIVKLAETQRGGGNFLVKIAPDSKLVKVDREQIKDKLLESMGIDPKMVKRGIMDAATEKAVGLVEQQLEHAPGLFEFMVHGQTPKGNIMAVLEDGKPTYYEVADPLLFRAVSSLNRAPQHWIIKWLGMPKRVGQMTITLTPDFMVANLARDTIMGAVMSRAGFRPVMDSLKGMASRIKQDPTYREYLANGGGFASYLADESTFRAHLDRFYTSKGINPKTVLDTPDKMMYFIETLADAFEMSTRLGEYKRMREQGEHPRHAAYVAREVSTDFAMKGDSQVLGAMYDTVMFLRPAVVSMDRLYRGLAHDPNKGAIAAKAGTIALLSAWLYWQNKDNPRYQDMEDWKKDNYWHFYIPVNGKEEHFMYPKIWEVGALASIAERTVAELNNQEPEYAKSVGKILKNLFSLNLMPQVIAPLFEQATNRNSFTNAPIETRGMENMQPFMRAKPTTSETLKVLGMATSGNPEALQVNPVRAEALLRGYFNTWGMYGLMLTDSAFFSDQLPEKRMDELPVVRRFYESDPARHTKYETMYYDMLGEAQRLQGTIRELDKGTRTDIVDKMDKALLDSGADTLELAGRDLRNINKDMVDVRRSMLTPAEKRTQLDELTIEKNKLLKEAVLEVKRNSAAK